jgi:hypothetical protein
MAWVRAFPWIASAIVTLLLIGYVVAVHVLRVSEVRAPSPPTVRVVDRVVYLPMPKRVTNVSIEEALLWRRSIREYVDKPLTVVQLSMLLWAAYGVNDARWGFRTTPSAGATYPLEIYVVVGERGVAVNETQYLEAGGL